MRYDSDMIFGKLEGLEIERLGVGPSMHRPVGMSHDLDKGAREILFCDLFLSCFVRSSLHFSSSFPLQLNSFSRLPMKYRWLEAMLCLV